MSFKKFGYNLITMAAAAAIIVCNGLFAAFIFSDPTPDLTASRASVSTAAKDLHDISDSAYITVIPSEDAIKKAEIALEEIYTLPIKGVSSTAVMNQNNSGTILWVVSFVPKSKNSEVYTVMVDAQTGEILSTARIPNSSATVSDTAEWMQPNFSSVPK